MRNYYKKLEENRVPEYTCPTNCTTNTDEEDDGTSDFTYNNQGQTLKIDPSLDVWKYGDVPTGDDLDIASSKTREESPQQFFGTSDPQTIYYNVNG